jgi:ornithine carbamoyltransferase
MKNTHYEHQPLPNYGGKALKSIKHLLSLADLGATDLSRLVDRSVRFACSRGIGWTPVLGKIVGVYFRVPSTRTRSSFTVGALRLGAQTVTYGPNDLQIATGETLEDTGRVLSGYLDALVIRTNNGIAEMREIAKQHEMAVINAMSDNEHPTQAIADLSTLKERFGLLSGIHLLYLGEGNNTAAALALAVSQTPGMKATFVTPEGYGLPEPVIDQAQQLAGRCGGTIEHRHNIEELPRNVDAVYATRWRTMGAHHSDPHWIDKFRPFCITPQIMAKVSKAHSTVFLHDLPAVRGEDVHPEVLNGPQCLAWRQARHKLFSAMAVLEWCLGE